MEKLTNREIVYNLLREYGCSTSKQLANLAYRDFNVQVTATQMAGAMRPLVNAGRIGASKDEKGSTRYWLNRESELWATDVELNDLTGIWRFKK